MFLFSTGEKHIFAEKSDPKKERWEGKRLSASKIAENLSFSSKDGDECHDYHDFWNKLPKLIQNKNTIYWDYNNEPSHHQKILNLLSEMHKNLRGGDFGPTNLKHSSCLLDELRLFKDPAEIELMKKAAYISALAHKKLMLYTRNYFKLKKSSKNETFQDSVYEYTFRSFLEAEFMKEGVDSVAYPSIVAGGENATVLHYISCQSKVKNTDLLLVDAGCEYQGYASDITRTYPVSGKFSEAQKDIYQIVLAAQKEALKECKPGSTLGKVHNRAVQVLCEGLWNLGLFKKCIKQEKGGKFILTKPSSLDEVMEKKYYYYYYMHYTSHYLGLDVHDIGNYYNNKKKHRKLEPGMVFTVEPGLYFPKIYQHIPNHYKGMGIRIEDDVLITKKGKEVLTQLAPKEINELELSLTI